MPFEIYGLDDIVKISSKIFKIAKHVLVLCQKGGRELRFVLV